MEKEYIDELFKKGLANSEVTYEEEHWTAMERRLRLRSKQIKFLWVASIASAAVILMTVFLVLWQPEVHRHSPAVSVTVVKPVKDTSIVTPHIKATAIHADEIKLKQERRKLNEERTKLPLAYMEKRVDRQRVLLPPIKTITWNIPESNQKLLVWQDLGVEEEDALGEKKITSVAQEDQLQPIQSKLKPYVTLTWAPDLTSVQGAERQSFSGGIGLLYTVPLNHRISISGGALYAKKNYSSPYSFYKPNVRLTWSEKPTNVDAACDVLDIPINLNYQFYQRGRSKFTASGGISSYFMLREQYHFAYANEAAYDQSVIDYEVRGQNNHLFGVANLSVTFERQLNKRFSIGIQPFVKLPLTGIGYGQTKLMSKGIAVSVNFKGGK